MSGPKGYELILLQQEQDRLAKERAFHTASNYYKRRLAEWISVQGKCEVMEIAASFSPTPHEKLLQQLVGALNKGEVDKALKKWETKSSELDQVISTATSQLADLENRNVAHFQEIENYRHHFQKVNNHLESLISKNWENSIRSVMLQSLSSLKDECAPLNGMVSGSKYLNAKTLAIDESVLRAKHEKLKNRAKDFGKELERIHREHLTSQMLSNSATTKKIADFLPSLALVSEEPDDTNEKLNELIRDIAALEDSIDWHAILQEAERIRAEKDIIYRKNLLANLIIRCSGRLKDIKNLSSWRENLLQLIDEASSIPKDKILGEFRMRLELISRKDLPCDLAPLKKELATILSEAIAHQEQEKKRQAVVDSLTELGYEISGGMSVGEVIGGKMEFRKAGENEYAISVMIDNNAEILETEMVRYAESDAMSTQQEQRDIEKEEDWCADHAKAMKSLKAKGVNTGFLYKKRPGEHPVRVELNHTAHHIKKSDALKDRTLKSIT